VLKTVFLGKSKFQYLAS